MMISVSVECPPINRGNINNINIVNDVSKDEDEECSQSDASISPILVSMSNSEIVNSPGHGARHIYAEEEMSPLSLSVSISPPRTNESVGDCGICYKSLPIQSNHIYTVCGHLFCVKCLFNWNNTSSTCPMCRKLLYENINNSNNVETLHRILPNSNIYNYTQSIESDLSSHDTTFEIYAHTTDLIEWPDDPNEGDILINDISERESLQLYNFRISSLDIFRRKIYFDNLFSDRIFTGRFTYEFIPRNHYIYLNVGSEHLYEFVIRKNTLDDNIDEINFIGYLIEFNSYEPDDYLIISILHPRFIDYQLTYIEETNNIDYSNLIFKFSNVRRLYAICPVYER
jgi:hypothetical protein